MISDARIKRRIKKYGRENAVEWLAWQSIAERYGFQKKMPMFLFWESSLCSICKHFISGPMEGPPATGICSVYPSYDRPIPPGLWFSIEGHRKSNGEDYGIVFEPVDHFAHYANPRLVPRTMKAAQNLVDALYYAWLPVTFTNEFHKTSVTLITKDGKLSPGQVKKARRVLCGTADCRCGGNLSETGTSIRMEGIVPRPDGGVDIVW
jgi:hypothetical protein